MKKISNQSTIGCVLVGLILVAVLAPLSIPVGPIPVTLQTLVLFLVTGVLGKKPGTIVAILYLICGAIGLPVFSDFSSGIQKFIGPTAGFIWAFPFMCYLLGWLIEKNPKRYLLFISHFIIVHLLLLIIGFLVFMMITESSQFPLDNVLSLLPGVFLKSVIGGSLSLWISNKLIKIYPSQQHNSPK